VIFVGCPQATQLIVPALYKLGHDPVILTGEVMTWEGKEVRHIWIEMPDLGLRIETNPSQILGWPVVATVMPLEEDAERYEDATPLDNWEQFPALVMTPAGKAYFGRMSDQVVACFLGRIKKKRIS